MFRKTLLCLAAAVIVTMATEIRANLVVNGDFEDPQIGGSFDTLPPPPLPGWTVLSGTVDLIHDYWVPFQPTQSLDLDGLSPGTISQDLPTVAGRLYTVTYAFSNNPDGSGQDFNGQPTSFPAHALVTVIGTISNALLGSQDIWHDQTAPGSFPRATSLSNMNWDVASFSFVADGPSTTLTFASQDINSTPWGIALDQVSVVPTGGVNPAVPEPTGLVVWSLLAGGSAGLAAARKRRRGHSPRWSQESRAAILSVIAGRNHQ